MSAENWRMCPNCKNKIKENKKRLIAQAQELKNDPDQYNALIDEATDPPELEETLGEYYYTGSKDNEVKFNYSCQCERCGFKFEYEKKIVMFEKGK